MAKQETLAIRLDAETKQTITHLSKSLGFSQGEFISLLILKIKDNKELLNSLRPVIK